MLRVGIAGIRSIARVYGLVRRRKNLRRARHRPVEPEHGSPDRRPGRLLHRAPPSSPITKPCCTAALWTW